MTVAETARLLQARAPKRPARRRARAALPALFAMSDEARVPDPLAALRCLPRGAAIILRHYGAPSRAALARRLVEAARRRGVAVAVAGDWRLAVRTGAAGVHLPEAALKASLPLGAAVRAKKLFVTMAAHSLGAVFKAARRGASAAIVGAVFPTPSHPGRPCLGVLRFAALCRKSPIPVVALGGIDARSAMRLLDSGAAGIAGIGGVLGRGQGYGAEGPTGIIETSQ